MFAFLRKLIVPIMVTVLVFFLATIVFDWGMKASSSRQVKDSVGYINGENITTRMFDSYYQNILRKEEEKVDYDLPPDKIEEIKKEAWNQLMIDFLINQEINKHKIYVSDEEIYEFLKLYPPSELRTTPQFMTDGKFDYQKYVKAMVNPEMASYWTAIENFIIPELKKYKLQEEIISTVRVSPAEVQDAFLADRESVKIGYLYFPAARFMTNLPQITQDELKKYYDSHRDEYKRPKRATFDMVLFEKAPTENDWEKIGYRIKEIYDSAVGGSDFAELARAYSEDNSASQGGDLGWFGRKQMVPEFDSVVWLLKANEVSKPFRSRFGWHIVKLLNKKSEKETSMTGANPLEIEKVNAAHILLKVTPSQETMDQIELNAKDFATQASELGFEKAAKDLKYEIRSTTPFAENDYIQYLGANQGASDFAFRNKPGKVSDMMENNSTYFVLKVRAHLPEGYASFEEVNEVVSQEVTAEKAKEASFDTAQIA
ncbi:MAG: peptidylprolyl isomerase, partial [candidate division Zixibacteria bacterium]|nr:peptidylprolyl isomerase [candidate division Zixibacteria bacterium]